MFWVCLFDCYYCFESDCCSNQLSPKSATLATLNIHFFLQMLRDGSIKYQKMAQVKYKYLKKNTVTLVVMFPNISNILFLASLTDYLSQFPNIAKVKQGYTHMLIIPGLHSSILFAQSKNRSLKGCVERSV